MSVYGTTWMVDGEDHDQTCAKWVECDCGEPWGAKAHVGRWMGSNGDKHWRFDESSSCTCLCGPIVYRGSHILPSDEDQRGGSLSFGEIPGFITRDGQDDGDEDDDRAWPFLRVTIRQADAGDCQDVLLDLDQIMSLARYLTGLTFRVYRPADRVSARRPVVDVHLPESPSGGVDPLAVT